MSLQRSILIVAIASTLIPVVAVLIRGRTRRLMILATLLTSVAVSLHLVVLLRVVEMGPKAAPTLWVYALIASTLPILLAGYVLSVGFGQGRPDESFLAARRKFCLLGISGAALLAMLGHRSFLTGYDWNGGHGTIHIGSLGKIYLVYLLLGIIGIGYNLERTYRTAAVDVRYRIRLSLLGIFGLLGFYTFILATGMLYSGLGLGKLVASSLPIAIASLAISYGYLRGAITDVTAPVSRNIVYSSFTALAAALFVLAIGAAAQVATWTHWSPDEILIVTFAFLAILVAVLLIFSNGFQRVVRGYIDRNFYVDRYDYRTQWSHLTRTLQYAADPDSVLNLAGPFLQEAFAAKKLTIALWDQASCSIRPVRGKGSDVSDATLDPVSPLALRFIGERKALLLDRKPDDFDYLPIYVENDKWLDETASQMVAPLLDGGQLVGTIGLERDRKNDPFTYEDVALLESIASHIAATLRSMQLVQDLAEARESQLISQWSSMLLHDMKNYLAPLRMVGTNLLENKDNPEAIDLCVRDITQVIDRMENLVHALSELRNRPKLDMEYIHPNQIVQDTLSAMQVARRPGISVDLHLDAGQLIRGDSGMLQRVLENLIANAIDAMEETGTLSIATSDHRTNGTSKVHIEVADTGRGIPDDFMRSQLFRPFATTKRNGVGLGLYQCRTIVQAHGGQLAARKRRGTGTVFQIALGAARLNQAARSVGGPRTAAHEAVE